VIACITATVGARGERASTTEAAIEAPPNVPNDTDKSFFRYLNVDKTESML
jgi:hypothetical protein